MNIQSVLCKNNNIKKINKTKIFCIISCSHVRKDQWWDGHKLFRKWPESPNLAVIVLCKLKNPSCWRHIEQTLLGLKAMHHGVFSIGLL